MPSPSTCRVINLGTMDYQRSWDLQANLASAVREARQPNTLLFVEHPHTYTMGRLSLSEHLLLPQERLQAEGIEVIETDRGGQVTYHGPEQQVVYPVVDLKDWGSPAAYVHTLEQIIIKVLADLDINAGVLEGITGVWVDGAKIAAIGIKISRGVAYHGFAINVNTDLSYYDGIIPCGIEDRPVTSMAKVLGEELDMEMVRYSVSYQFGKAMGFRMVDGEPASVDA